MLTILPYMSTFAKFGYSHTFTFSTDFPKDPQV